MIAGIVLAGGAATRFGATKQIAEVRGKPLVQHAVDALADADIDEIVVVLGHDAATVAAAIDLPAGARTIVNGDWEQGQSSSLRMGLAAVADSEAAVILLADQPGITVGHVVALIEGFRSDPSPIVRLRFDDGPGPALLSSEIYGAAAALTGDTGARALVERRPGDVREVRVEGPAPRDIDEPGDLARA